MANPLAQQIEKVLASAVGDFIAKATLKKNCELIGSTPDTLTSAELAELVAHIEKSVSFFSGKEVGGDVAEKIMNLGG
ncbi:MAG: hypothetical protein CVT63_03700 [Candidatus Anoxymicrobium japonicum]|uniref:Uncharacterized protein n=1 Tax=Candidatus Anoxymicrobium japonicum TaxID=2013648 RepID=A0A2N3G6A9_9ACTN|nr:MAG: hypothetical protein CVT63_03700 [Candidatus Anoxymicrobium japonicum]